MKSSVLKEIVLVLLFTGASVCLLERAAILGYWADQISMVALVLAFTLIPMAAAKKAGISPANLGWTTQDAFPSALFGLKVSAVVLPLFALGFFLIHGFTLSPEKLFRISSGGAVLLLWNLVGIAIPEEFFFRGYLQTRIATLLPGKINLRWTSLSHAAIVAGLFFALFHLPLGLEPTRLLVFFPGLLFGWVRERTDSITGPVALHFLANTTLWLLTGRLSQ